MTGPSGRLGAIITGNWEMGQLRPECSSAGTWRSGHHGGLNHSLAVKTDGSLHGVGTIRDSWVMVPILIYESNTSCVFQCKSVAAGNYHSCTPQIMIPKFICHGMEQYGQLGDGTTTDRNSPIKSAEDSNVEHIAAGIFLVIIAQFLRQCFGA